MSTSKHVAAYHSRVSQDSVEASHGLQFQDMLISAADSVLVVIDVQWAFINKLPELNGTRHSLIGRISWLIGVANWMNIPLVVTAEDITNSGDIIPEIREALSPANNTIYNKMSFGLTADKDILNDIQETRRLTTILVGLETDVCVSQSALGLLNCGYRVVVVEDATASPGPAHAIGIERIRRAGGIIVSTKSLFYEWLRTVDMMKQFRSECQARLGIPDGVTL